MKIIDPELAALFPNFRPVEPEKLREVLGEADRMVVSEGPRPNSPILFTSTEAKDIAEFNDALTVIPPDGLSHCMCDGTPAVRLYRGDTELALVTNHHGHAVRCSLWDSDAELVDCEKWLRWFDERNLPQPRKEVEAAKVRAEESRARYTRWLSAMPTCVRAAWEQAKHDPMGPECHHFRQPLADGFPNVRQRIRVLYGWNGSGAGPWSGYPAYESIAEELLLDFPTPDLVAAAQMDDLTDAEIEGAARLFASWNFAKKRPDDLQRLPLALKQTLLEHARRSTNEDNVRRAERAFQG
jgi:hypothetical protein